MIKNKAGLVRRYVISSRNNINKHHHLLTFRLEGSSSGTTSSIPNQSLQNCPQSILSWSFSFHLVLWISHHLSFSILFSILLCIMISSVFIMYFNHCKRFFLIASFRDSTLNLSRRSSFLILTFSIPLQTFYSVIFNSGRSFYVQVADVKIGW